MTVVDLDVWQFRNLAKTRFVPGSQFNVISGPNGSGKTNLLEAIYLMANVRSFRPGPNTNLINFDGEETKLEARVQRASVIQALSMHIEKGRKRLKVNNNTIKRFSDYLGQLQAVIFSPSDLVIAKGSSKERRRYLDRIICHTKPAHLKDLQDFEQVLRLRNRLLKEGARDRTLLEIYDEQFLEISTRILVRRLEASDEMSPLIRNVFQQVFGGEVEFSMFYQMSWTEADVLSEMEQIREELSNALKKSFSLSCHRGITLVGPHRDDLLLKLDGRSVKDFASQGQSRTVVLSMKIGEICYIEERTQERPVLLLDDVSSELDSMRNEQLFRYISNLKAQTFITTTDMKHVHVGENRQDFSLVDGLLTACEKM